MQLFLYVKAVGIHSYHCINSWCKGVKLKVEKELVFFFYIGSKYSPWIWGSPQVAQRRECLGNCSTGDQIWWWSFDPLGHLVPLWQLRFLTFYRNVRIETANVSRKSSATLQGPSYITMNASVISYFLLTDGRTCLIEGMELSHLHANFLSRRDLIGLQNWKGLHIITNIFHFNPYLAESSFR